MAGSREVLFQAATNKLQTYLDGTQASQSPRAAPEERLSDWHGLCACFAMFNVIGGAFTPLGALTLPVGGVAAPRDYLPTGDVAPYKRSL